MRLTNKFRRQDRNPERGVTMVMVAIAMVAIIAMAAMSIDLVTLYLAREEAQRAADAAALAAARVISVSGITGTANPATNTGYWRDICGSGSTNGWATQAALAAAAQNSVGGNSVAVTVKYSDGSSARTDCSNLSAAFAVNPLVIVQIAPTNIPSFFSRIWGIAGNSISASATAEVFNPSASNGTGIATNGNVTPVEPRCVKPWIVPNLDPGNCSPPDSTACAKFVNPGNGAIVNAGIFPPGPGVIGETFNLFADCGPLTTTCLGGPGNPPGNPPDNPPNVNVLASTKSYIGGGPPPTPNLEYVPSAVPHAASAFSAVPSCAPGTDYGSAVAGCDHTTVYQCGQQMSSLGSPNLVDLRENPGGPAGDSALGLACSLTGNASLPLSGEDTLRPSPYPFVVLTGTANPLNVAKDTPVTSSNSIVSLPIYDGTSLTISTNTAPVTIVGFLQVFVNSVDQTDGRINVRVLNVAGCGSSATTNPAVSGSSPVPVRLITPPPLQ